MNVTGSGTEANNIAIFSAAGASPDKKHIISSVVEHASVLEPLRFLEKHGYEIELLDVDRNGAIDIDRLRAYQAGEFACAQNAAALWHLETALEMLNQRTADRISRGVEGKFEK